MSRTSLRSSEPTAFQRLRRIERPRVAVPSKSASVSVLAHDSRSPRVTHSLDSTSRFSVERSRSRTKSFGRSDGGDGMSDRQARLPTTRTALTMQAANIQHGVRRTPLGSFSASNDICVLASLRTIFLGHRRHGSAPNGKDIEVARRHVLQLQARADGNRLFVRKLRCGHRETSLGSQGSFAGVAIESQGGWHLLHSAFCRAVLTNWSRSHSRASTAGYCGFIQDQPVVSKQKADYSNPPLHVFWHIDTVAQTGLLQKSSIRAVRYSHCDPKVGYCFRVQGDLQIAGKFRERIGQFSDKQVAKINFCCFCLRERNLCGTV